MGVESRDYYRQRNTYDGAWGDWGLYHLTPVVKWIIIINVVVFVLQLFLVRNVPPSPIDILRQQDPDIDHLLTEYGDGPAGLEKVRGIYPTFDEMLRTTGLQAKYHPGQQVSIIQEAFALETKKVMRGQVWRPLTHAFCHDRGDLFHILFNMLFLYWFGCTLESMYGSREFLLFYLTAAMAAALAYVALDLYTGTSVPAVGASGAVMAVMMLYAWHFPRETIYMMWVLPVQVRFLIVFYVIWDLHPVLLQLGGDRARPPPTSRSGVRLPARNSVASRISANTCPACWQRSQLRRCRCPTRTWTAWTRFWRKSTCSARPT